MCGIALIGSCAPDPLYPSLRVLLRRIAHRGEVGLRAEHLEEDGVALGANRLAIQSDATWGQPIESARGQIVLVYNGELYNHREMAKLSHTECDRVSRYGDGAVVADAIEQHGPLVVEKFDGMFAVAWLDRRTRCIHWARDRMGIKPLYRSVSGPQLFLASELKALAPERTIREIIEVKPGTVGTATRSSGEWVIQSDLYWSIDDCQPTRSELDPVELGRVLTDAVERVLDCPHDMGIYLSGGLDSAGLFAIAHHLGRQLTPLTLATRESLPSVFDDGKNAVEFARSFDTDCHVRYVPSSDELFEQVRSTIFICESFEPNVVRQSSVQRYISAMAEEAGLRVVLTGEGADELFCGYPDMLVDRERAFSTRAGFVKDLYRTQLQRVDRMSMHYTTEVRVPYLLNAVVDFALSSWNADDFMTLEGSSGLGAAKSVLRKALRGLANSAWYTRPKVVLSEGVGFGGNDAPGGFFQERIAREMGHAEVAAIASENPDWTISSAEEAFYFREFRRLGYHKCVSAQQRVVANRIRSVGYDCAPVFG